MYVHTSMIFLPYLLRQVIQHWDKSIYQFPVWLKYNFGSEEVKNEIDRYSAQATDPDIIDKLKTLRWWLDREYFF